MAVSSRLLLTLSTILAASIISSTLLYGVFANSLPALIATGVLVIFLIGLIPLRRKASRMIGSSRFWRYVSRMGLSSRQKMIAIILVFYFLFAGAPAIRSYFYVVPGVTRPWTAGDILVSFGAWAVVFAFFYGVYWILDALADWRRSLRTK